MGKTRMNLLYRVGAILCADDPTEGGAGSEPQNGDDSSPDNVNQKATDDDEPLGEPGLKALKAERKRAAEEKRRADIAESKLQEIADAEKTELQRAQERIAELEKTTKEYEDAKARSELRASVLSNKNVPSEWADFVTGDSEDEMNKAADRILANLSQADQGPFLRQTSGKPGGSLEAGREAAKNYRP